MPKKKMWVEWDDGADLSQSRKKPGAFSPLTRDEDKNLGQVTLSDVDAGEELEPGHPDYLNDHDDSEAEDETEGVLGALIVLGVLFAGSKAAPHVVRWWNNSPNRFVASLRVRLSRARQTGSDVVTAEPVTVAEVGHAPTSQEVLDALDEYKASMTSAEARERFVAALVARLYSEEQLRLLRNARIDDDGSALELASAMETLTPERLEESITKMLEAHPSWPDDDTLAELERVLGRRSAGEYVPARREQITEALRLTDGEQ